MNEMTSAEQLVFVRRVVEWTLWRIATTDPEQGPTDADPNFQKHLPIRGYDTATTHAIQGHAESLFSDSHWVADVVGAFAANHASNNPTIDFAAFDSATRP